MRSGGRDVTVTLGGRAGSVAWQAPALVGSKKRKPGISNNAVREIIKKQGSAKARGGRWRGVPAAAPVRTLPRA